jgi:hypothetical protein
MGSSVWQGKRAGSRRIGGLYIGMTGLNPNPGAPDYRSAAASQKASAATAAEAGMVITQA